MVDESFDGIDYQMVWNLSGFRKLSINCFVEIRWPLAFSYFKQKSARTKRYSDERKKWKHDSSHVSHCVANGIRMRVVAPSPSPPYSVAALDPILHDRPPTIFYRSLRPNRMRMRVRIRDCTQFHTWRLDQRALASLLCLQRKWACVLVRALGAGALNIVHRAAFHSHNAKIYTEMTSFHRSSQQQQQQENKQRFFAICVADCRHSCWCCWSTCTLFIGVIAAFALLSYSIVGHVRLRAFGDSLRRFVRRRSSSHTEMRRANCRKSITRRILLSIFSSFASTVIVSVLFSFETREKTTIIRKWMVARALQRVSSCFACRILLTETGRYLDASHHQFGHRFNYQPEQIWSWERERRERGEDCHIHSIILGGCGGGGGVMTIYDIVFNEPWSRSP